MATLAPITAWTGTAGLSERKWIAANWYVERIVTNYDPQRFNFSTSTAKHESLLICRRLSSVNENRPTEHISLRRRPTDEREAHECVEAILSGRDGPNWFTRTQIPAERIRTGDWDFAAWHQPELERVVQVLERHAALVPLESRAKLGPAKQQTDQYWRKATKEETPVTWGHWSNSEAVQTLKYFPETALVRKSRNSRRPPPQWDRESSKTSALLITAGNCTTSGRVFAVWSPVQSFGRAFQPILMNDEDSEPAIAGWINSTPGRLLVLNRRADKLTFPTYNPGKIRNLPIPEAPAALAVLDKAVRSCWDETVAQGRDGADCAVRIRLDSAAAKVLGVPEEKVACWRRMLAQEPTISGRMVRLDN